MRGFGFKNKLSKSVIDILNKIDLEYMRAYSTRTTIELQPFLTPECLQKVSCYIHGHQDRYFADVKFRNTSWDLQKVNKDGLYIILKDVTHDKIKVTKTLRINAAEDYRELWAVKIEGASVRIANIIQC